LILNKILLLVLFYLNVQDITWKVRNRPPVLKEDLKATFEIGMARKSFAIICKIGYFNPLAFYQTKMSNYSCESSSVGSS